MMAVLPQVGFRQAALRQATKVAKKATQMLLPFPQRQPNFRQATKVANTTTQMLPPFPQPSPPPPVPQTARKVARAPPNHQEHQNGGLR